MKDRFTTFARATIVCGLASLFAANAWSQPTPTESRAASDGDKLMRDVVEVAVQLKSVEARLRVRTDLLGQSLVGSGTYAQAASTVGPLLRLELAIQAGEQATSVKQVSDGQVLWESWRIGQQNTLNRIDLRKVQAAARRAGPQAIPTSTSASLATGGIPKLLRQLEANFDFGQSKVRSGKIGDVPVFALSGVWRGEKLAKAAPKAVRKEKILFEELPDHLPHQVELLIGQSDYFPYRVTYQRWKTKDGKLALSPVVTTEFFEVSSKNEPIDMSQFVFQNPNKLAANDRTESFLKALGLKPTEVADRVPIPKSR